MERIQSIEPVVQELSSGNPLYAFKPDDVQANFFIGETIIIAAATAFVTAFFKGVNSALEKRGEELGKKVTNWLADKIQGLFQKPEEAKAKEEELKKELAELSKSASKADKKTKNDSLDFIEKAIVEELEGRGVLPKKAKEIAKKSRESAETILSKKG